MNAVLLGIYLLCSTGIGGGIAWIVSKLFIQSKAGLALICGGFLVGLLTLDIIPAALDIYRPFGLLLGALLGFFFFEALHHLFHSTGSSVSVYMLAIAMLIHTIPLSMTIGNLLDDPALGVTIATSIILHHLPEGFALTTVVLSKGDKLWGLVLCFIGLSVCFTFFIWIGQHTHLTEKVQSVLMGVSVSLIACTSIKEFIGQYIRTIPLRPFLSYIGVGYLFSSLFHFLF